MKPAKWFVTLCLVIRPALGENLGELVESRGFTGEIICFGVKQRKNRRGKT